MLASSDGINWTWYLDFSLDDGIVTIKRHYREHYSKNPPETLMGFSLVEENESRVVKAVRLFNGGKMTEYPVSNPLYIWDYPSEPEAKPSSLETNVSVYSIHYGRDLLLGTAHDPLTLLSLIQLSKMCDATGVSLHGNFRGRILSGEQLHRDAEELVLDEEKPE